MSLHPSLAVPLRKKWPLSLVLAAALSACGGGSSGGPGAGTGGVTGDAASGRGGAVTWGAWANPGEAERFKQVSKAY